MDLGIFEGGKGGGGRIFNQKMLSTFFLVKQCFFELTQSTKKLKNSFFGAKFSAPEAKP